MPQGERRLTAIMFTDMVGYTALGQTDENSAMELLDEQRDLLRSFFPRYGGREVKTMGDAFLVQFKSALEASKCATDIQESLHELNAARPSERRIVLRIGVHVGDVIDEGSDIHGDAVNIASRIEPLASPGGVCISGQAYDQVRNKMPLPMVKLEGQTLKNVSVPMDVFRVVMPWDEGNQMEDESWDTKRVAVLPFYNMSSSPDDEFFADGMTEELITTLSKVGDLSVISRTSVMPYRKAPKAIREVARDLKAGTIIEGSVRKSGETFRITVQMIDAKNDKHVWADSYDRDLHDVFAVQSEIASKVTDTLKVRLAESERIRLGKPQTRSTDAFVLYLKGRQLWNQRDGPSVQKAIEYFKQAVEADRNYALGYSGLADCHYVLAYNGLSAQRENYEAAKGYASKALALDGDLAEAHAALAVLMENYEFRFKEAEEEFKKAISLNPSYATAHQWYGQLLINLGRREESYAEIDRAMELDPLSPIIRTARATAHYFGTRDAGTWISELKKVEMLFPGFHSDLDMAWAFVYGSKFDEAMRAADIMLKSGYGQEMVDTFRAYVMAKAGDINGARKILLVEEGSEGGGRVPPTLFAYAHLAMNEKDRAFEFLQQAYQERDSWLTLLKIDPDWDGIRSDPRYQDLLNGMGL